MTTHNVENIAAQVALLLTADGMPFRLEDRADRVTFAKIRREDGAGVCFHFTIYPGPRIHLSGEWPRKGSTCHLYGKYQDAPKISVAPDRPPAAIAGEIKRRLLPFYLPLYAEALRDKAADERRRAEAVAVALDLEEILRTRARGLHGEHPSEEIVLYPDTESGSHASVKLLRGDGGGACFSIDISDGEKTRELAAWIVQNLRPRGLR